MTRDDSPEIPDDEAVPLHPDARARGTPSGTPAVLGDGNTWLLADGGLCNDLDEIRDRIFDRSALSGTFAIFDGQVAANAMLHGNYDLTGVESAGLVLGAEPEALCRAVQDALYGTSDGPATYTDWAASALLANGLDPAAVPTRLLPHVLRHLVASKRVIPQDQFVHAIEAGRKRALFRGIAEAQAAKRAAEAEAAPAPAGQAPPEGSPGG